MTAIQASIAPSAKPAAMLAAAKQPPWNEALRNGSRVSIRPIHALDAELERRFIEGLSPQSQRFRFLESMKSPSDALLKQSMAIDPATDAAYVALAGTGAEEREIGVARFNAAPGGNDCEFAVVVGDEWQHTEFGSALMKRLIETAGARGIESMHSNDAAENEAMRKFAARLNYHHKRDPDDAKLVRYSVDLKTATG